MNDSDLCDKLDRMSPLTDPQGCADLMGDARLAIMRLRTALGKAYQFISPLSDPMPISAGEMAKEIIAALSVGQRE